MLKSFVTLCSGSAGNLGSHCLAHFVSQNKTRLVLYPEIPAHRQHALALDLVAENRDGEQVSAELLRAFL